MNFLIQKRVSKKADSACLLCDTEYKNITRTIIPTEYRGEKVQLQISKEAFDKGISKFCHASMNDNQICL